MKKLYEYTSVVSLNQAMRKFEADDMEVCVKIGNNKFYLVVDDEEGETEEEGGEEQEKETEGESEGESKKA